MRPDTLHDKHYALVLHKRTPRHVMLGALCCASSDSTPTHCGNGFWLADVTLSRDTAVIDAYLCWIMYSRGGPVHRLMGDLSMEIVARRKDVASAIGKRERDATLSDIRCIAEGCVIDVLLRKEDITSVHPDATMEQCLCYYSKGCLAAIVHEKHLSSTTVNAFKHMSLRLSIAPILPCKIWSRATHDVMFTLSRHAIVKPLQDHDVIESSTKAQHCVTTPVEAYDGLYTRVYDGIESLVEHVIDLDANVLIWMYELNNDVMHAIILALARHVMDCMCAPLDTISACGVVVVIKAVLQNGHRVEIKNAYRLISTPVECTSSALFTSLEALSNTIRNFGWPDPLSYATASSYFKALFYDRYYDQSTTPLYTLSQEAHKFITMSCHSRTHDNITMVREHSGNGSAIGAASDLGAKSLPYGPPMLVTGCDNVNALLSKTQNMPFGFYRVRITGGCSEDVEALHAVHCNDVRGIMEEDIVMFVEELAKGIEMGCKYDIKAIMMFDKAPVMRALLDDVRSCMAFASESENSYVMGCLRYFLGFCHGYMGFDRYDRLTTRVYGTSMCADMERYWSQNCTSYTRVGDVMIVNERRNIPVHNISVALHEAMSCYIRLHRRRQQAL